MGIQSPTMASKSAQFLMSGTNKQFEFVYSKYQEALQANADSKNSKSEVLLKLDKWYQNELPKKIKSRGKESHLTHEELVQLIKWKLALFSRQWPQNLLPSWLTNASCRCPRWRAS